jgi:hypothetical protein
MWKYHILTIFYSIVFRIMRRSFPYQWLLSMMMSSRLFKDLTGRLYRHPRPFRVI